MWPLRISTATATASVLMAQLCKKRRIFFVPGCMVRDKNQRATSCASLRRKTRGVFLMDSESTSLYRFAWQIHLYLDCLLFKRIGRVTTMHGFCENVIQSTWLTLTQQSIFTGGIGRMQRAAHV